MASLPTITLLRAVEPDDFAADSLYKTKQKQLPREEILFLPPEKQRMMGDSLNHSDAAKSDSFYRKNKRGSAYEELSRYRM